MTTKHRSHLTQHLQERRFWVDIAILTALWLLLMLLPSTLFQTKIIKLVALVATLDLVAFFSFHAIGPKSSVLLQGFMGGFISSTGIFIKLCTPKFLRNTSTSPAEALAISQALLLALLAMLIECLFIVYAMKPEDFLRLSRPFWVQIVQVIGLSLFWLKKSARPAKTGNIQEFIEKPVIWVRVLKLSSLILVLIYGMQFLNAKLSLSAAWGAFVASLFEAHAVTAATLGMNSLSTDQARNILFLVLVGNAISKAFISRQSDVHFVRTRVPFFILGSTLVTGAIEFFF